MEIRFISSLTAEDENLFAPALLKAVGALLDQLPIAYTIRIETMGAECFSTHMPAPRNPRVWTPSIPSRRSCGARRSTPARTVHSREPWRRTTTGSRRVGFCFFTR